MSTPYVIVIAGPNGAGKSTTAPTLLREALGVTEFVNADVIAEGLSAYSPENVAMEAGRLMLGRLKHLAAARATFAFETTLSSRTFAPWLRALKAQGYKIAIMFFWLATPDQARARVRLRVSRGGHDVPEEVIDRRYHAGLRNFLSLYMMIADTWWVYDNCHFGRPQLVAQYTQETLSIVNEATWNLLSERHNG